MSNYRTGLSLKPTLACMGIFTQSILSKGEQERKCGTEVQAKAELSTEPLSNLILIVSLTNTTIRRIV